MMTATTESQTLDVLLDSIRARAARIGVIGLGHVGPPLVLLFEEAGFPVRVDPVHRGSNRFV